MAQTSESPLKRPPRHRVHLRYVLGCEHDQLSSTVQKSQWHARALNDGASFTHWAAQHMCGLRVRIAVCKPAEDGLVAVVQESTAPSEGHAAPSSSAAPGTAGPSPVDFSLLTLLRHCDAYHHMASAGPRVVEGCLKAAPRKRASALLAHSAAAWIHHDRMHMLLSSNRKQSL